MQQDQKYLKWLPSQQKFEHDEKKNSQSSPVLDSSATFEAIKIGT